MACAVGEKRWIRQILFIIGRFMGSKVSQSIFASTGLIHSKVVQEMQGSKHLHVSKLPRVRIRYQTGEYPIVRSELSRAWTIHCVSAQDQFISPLTFRLQSSLEPSTRSVFVLSAFSYPALCDMRFSAERILVARPIRMYDASWPAFPHTSRSLGLLCPDHFVAMNSQTGDATSALSFSLSVIKFPITAFQVFFCSCVHVLAPTPTQNGVENWSKKSSNVEPLK